MDAEIKVLETESGLDSRLFKIIARISMLYFPKSESRFIENPLFDRAGVTEGDAIRFRVAVESMKSDYDEKAGKHLHLSILEF